MKDIFSNVFRKEHEAVLPDAFTEKILRQHVVLKFNILFYLSFSQCYSDTYLTNISPFHKMMNDTLDINKLIIYSNINANRISKIYNLMVKFCLCTLCIFIYYQFYRANIYSSRNRPYIHVS